MDQTDNQLNLAGLVSQVCHAFTNEFDESPQWIAAAPGRVNLIGEHIDYNDGVVLPLAIDRYTVIAGRLSDSNSRVRLFSKNLDVRREIDLACDLRPTPGDWSNYVLGVIAGFGKRDLTVPGFDAVILSSVPAGSGLSSSAALEVAAATLIEGLIDTTIAKSDKAILCQQAEHEFAGVPCGAMDQFASVFGKAGHVVQLDCQTLGVEQLPFAVDNTLILVINSHAHHELADGQYTLRRQQSQAALAKLGLSSYRDLSFDQLQQWSDRLTDIEFRRARHVVTEIERTQQAASAIRASDWSRLGELLYESHRSLRDDYQVSCKELDLLVDLASQFGCDQGMFGSRMTGGGFGGCTVSLVEHSLCEELTTRIQGEYKSRTGIFPAAFATAPAEGAHLIKYDRNASAE